MWCRQTDDGIFKQPTMETYRGADHLADMLAFIPNHIVEVNWTGAPYDLPEQYDSALIAMVDRLRSAGVKVTESSDITSRLLGAYKGVEAMKGK